ncbi:periplasmic heavy metal sensor [Thiovibrio sp. JS02]
MKKTLLTIAAVATIGLAGFQLAEARPWAGGPGYMMGGPGCGQQVDEETAKAREKFFSETTELRKNMFAKRAELDAVLNATNPDEKKAAKLSAELFDLREAMHKKATESGIAGRGMGGGYFCNGPGGGPGAGPGGRGMGYGPGGCRF